MGKVVNKILQGSAVTQTVLGAGLTIDPPVANFLQCKLIWVKNYESWLAVNNNIATISMQAYFFGPPCTSLLQIYYIITVQVKKNRC